jgi:hypothetical protein
VLPGVDDPVDLVSVLRHPSIIPGAH